MRNATQRKNLCGGNGPVGTHNTHGT
jgi:hypothetical protein